MSPSRCLEGGDRLTVPGVEAGDASEEKHYGAQRGNGRPGDRMSEALAGVSEYG
jgi:hypothetical protein